MRPISQRANEADEADEAMRPEPLTLTLMRPMGQWFHKADKLMRLIWPMADTTEATEADEADLTDKAADATEVNGADEAHVADKPNEADKTEVNEANKAKNVTKEVNKAVEPMIWQGQQVNEANDATAGETNETIGVGVSVEAVNSDNEADGVLDNQLTELEKPDAANEAPIVSNNAGELSELAVTNNDDLIEAGSGELDDFVETIKAV